MTPPPTTVGGRIKKYRQDAGLSLTELATRSGLSKGYLSTLESSDESRPSGTTLYALAKVLGVTMSDLLGEQLLVESPTEIPSSLAKFAREAQLPQSDVRMLAAIKFRGEQPQSIDRWRYIYQAISNSRNLDEK